MKNVNDSTTKKEETTNLNVSEYYEKLFAASQEFWKKSFEEWQKQMQAAGEFLSMLNNNFDFNSADYYKNMATTAQDFWKKGFEEWQKQMQSAGQFPGMAENFDFADYYKNMATTSQDFWKKGFDEWQKQMQSLGSFPGMMDNANFNPVEFYKNMTTSAQDFWKKAGESNKTYSALVDLWRQLSEKTVPIDNTVMMEVYEKWNKQFGNLFKYNLTPNVPDYIKEFGGKWMDYFALSDKTMTENFKIWMDSGEDLQQALQKVLSGSPNAYIEFMESMKKNYENTFGRIAHHPIFGKDMEFWRRHRDSFDHFVKYNIAATGFYTAMYEVINESTQKVVEDYVTMSNSGEQPQTFDEFYKNWAKQVSATYDNVLFSEQYSKLAGNMVDEMAKFKIAYDKLCEAYLSHFPISKKSDMNALHKTVYDLKKELRSLKKEVKKEVKDNEK